MGAPREDDTIDALDVVAEQVVADNDHHGAGLGTDLPQR
jgi:hypothetical protein